MGHEEHKHHAPKSVKYAIITVSDSRDECSDTSGKTMVELLTSTGHEPVYNGVVVDDPDEIKRALENVLSEPDIQIFLL